MTRRYRARPKFYILLLSMLVVAFSISFLVANARLSSGANALAEKTAERDQLYQEIGDLENQIAFAQTEAYVERAARDELGLIRPGEVRYVNSGA